MTVDYHVAAALARLCFLLLGVCRLIWQCSLEPTRSTGNVSSSSLNVKCRQRLLTFNIKAATLRLSIWITYPPVRF